MLDLNNPQTEHIFAAARLEDAVLNYARRIISAPPSERPVLLALYEQSIDAMRTLNLERFGNSVFIASAINELHIAMRSLAVASSPNLNSVRLAFARLDSDEGFSTIRI